MSLEAVHKRDPSAAQTLAGGTDDRSTDALRRMIKGLGDGANVVRSRQLPYRSVHAATSRRRVTNRRCTIVSVDCSKAGSSG